MMTLGLPRGSARLVCNRHRSALHLIMRLAPSSVVKDGDEVALGVDQERLERPKAVRVGALGRDDDIWIKRWQPCRLEHDLNDGRAAEPRIGARYAGIRRCWNFRACHGRPQTPRERGRGPIAKYWS
jgi:hypothetical protein